MAKFLLKIKKWIEIIVIISLVIMTLIIFYQVFSRFVLNYTPPWIQPLSLLLMVWIGFAGIAIGIVDNTHIKVNLFVEMLPKTFQKVIVILQRLLALVFGFFMLVEGVKFSLKMKDSFMSSLGIPSAVLYAAIPVSGCIVVFYLIIELLSKRNKNHHDMKKVT